MSNINRYKRGVKQLSSKKKIQLLLLNGIIVLINIILFSNMFLGFSLFKGTMLTIGISWVDIIASIFVFLNGNLYILNKNEMQILSKDIKSLDDCKSVFEEAIHNGDVFDENIIKNIEQIKRFSRKSDTINDILKQKFEAEEMTYQKFNDVLQEVENVFLLNMRSIINKIMAFDVEEYESNMNNPKKRETISKEKMDIYNKYIEFVNNSTNINDEILLKLDKMILEISQYNTIDGGDIKKMPAIVEMDELIKNAGLYK